MKTCPFLPYSSDGNPDNPDQTSGLWGLLGEIMYTYSQLIRYVYIHNICFLHAYLHRYFIILSPA